MDIMTGVGLVSGIIVVSVMVLMGGDLHMFISEHAIIIIFGGSIAATMIRFPLSAILHGLPLGAKFAFTLSRLSARDLVEELARIAEIARKQGPVGLEKVETDEPFLAKGIRYVADGYDLEFIRDNLERDRDVLERLGAVGAGGDSGEQGVRAVLELHERAFRLVDDLRNVRQAQVDLGVRSEHLAGRDAREQGVRDLAGGARDDNAHGPSQLRRSLASRPRPRTRPRPRSRRGSWDR